MTYEEVRRETYNLPCRPILKHVPSPEVSFNDSLEGNTFIVSTEAPKHILKSNDNIMKTPSVQHPRKLHVQFKDLTFSPCQQDSPKIAFSPSAVSTLHKRTENSGVNSDTFDMSPNSSSATFTKGTVFLFPQCCTGRPLDMSLWLTSFRVTSNNFLTLFLEICSIILN